jgi:hypothetical protein
MPVTLILETGEGLVDANAYADADEATAYHETVLWASAWVAILADQERALMNATRLLDLYVDWLGAPTTTEQALRWPRTGVPTREGSMEWGVVGGEVIGDHEIPLWLKEATAEFARRLLESDRTGDGQAAGLSALSVSGLSMTFDSRTTAPPGVIPESVRIMVAPYGKVQQPGSIGMAKLRRV